MYLQDQPFPYAEKYYMILPVEFARNHERDGWDVIEQDDYSICFKPNTPDDIKERFVREYAEYYKKMREKGLLI